MGAALAVINTIIGVLPKFVALFEEALGIDHPAATQMRQAVADLQAAHEAATTALPQS